MWEKGGLEEEELYLYPLKKHQMCNTGSYCQTWPISFCRSKIEIMLEIALQGHLFDDKTHPVLNRDKLFWRQDFQMAAKMLCAAAGIQSWLLNAFDSFNQVQVTLFFSWMFVLSVRLQSYKQLCFSASGTRLLIPMKENHFKPCSRVKPWHFQAQQQECKFFVCPVVPWEQDG